MSETFNLSVSDRGIATLTFDLPGEKVNKFSVPVLEELEKVIDQLPKDGSIKILVFKSGKENVFIAGADLHSFEPAFEKPELAEKIIRTGHRVFAKLEKLPFPTVALINGACLGGGLEFVLSCTYRFVSDNPKTQLGLPEVTLGIFPGWGGTQRLPRLVGLENALNMILTGKAVNGLKAWKMGLADGICSYPFFEEQAADFVESLLSEKGREKIKERRNRRSFRKWILETNPLGKAILFSKSKTAVLEKTKGRYIAPLIALEVIKETEALPLSEGLKKEADTFIANIPGGFSAAKHFINLFFIQEALKKDPGANAKPKEIHSAGLIGAGTMGAIFGWLFTNNKIQTRLKDISWDIIGKAYGSVKSLYNKGVKMKRVTPSEAVLKFNLLSGTTDYSGFGHADFVLEAATENLDLKRKIFQELEEVVREDTLIASNTSSLTIDEMSEGMKHPERFVGMHFFNPPNKMPLVEIVGGEKSSPEAIATAVEFSKKLGKTPIVVGDCPGFLVNRIFVQGANEVLYLFQEGISRDFIINKVLDFGMPMDPFLLADEVGNDVAFKVTKTFEKAYGERMRGPKLLELLYERKLFGKKVDKGFYLYKEGEKREFNPEINQLLNLIERPKEPAQEEEALSRFINVMINEAARCLEEGIIKNPGYLDMALIMGIGFPPYRGGLLKYADEIGIEQIVDQLESFAKRYNIRYQPCQRLIEMRDQKSKFYSSGPTQVMPSSNQRKSLLSTF